VIVSVAGFSTAFVTLAGIAALGLVLFSIAMPETRNLSDETAERLRPALGFAIE
jgi:hypothetical protein